MVFGRTKKRPVDGLGKDERILHWWKYHSKKGFMKKEKGIAVLTNKRLVFALKADRKIFEEHPLSEITTSIFNQIYKSDMNAGGGGSTGWVTGNVKFMRNGEVLGNTDSIHDPQDLVNEINSCKMANVADELPPRVVLPMEVETTNEDNETDDEQAQADMEDPVKILKIRFAKGEITKEEFEDMKKTLE